MLCHRGVSRAMQLQRSLRLRREPVSGLALDFAAEPADQAGEWLVAAPVRSDQHPDNLTRGWHVPGLLGSELAGGVQALQGAVAVAGPELGPREIDVMLSGPDFREIAW